MLTGRAVGLHAPPRQAARYLVNIVARKLRMVDVNRAIDQPNRDFDFSACALHQRSELNHL
jgi:hypothetical protein